MATEHEEQEQTRQQQQEALWQLWQLMLQAALTYFRQTPDKWRGSTVESFRKFLADNNVVIDWAAERATQSSRSRLGYLLDSVELPSDILDTPDDDVDLNAR